MTGELTAEDFDRLAIGKLNYWVGTTAPLPEFVASVDVLEPDNDFRLGPTLHGTFDAVYYLEHDLGFAKQWRLILDELLRLLDDGGTLVLRYSPHRYFGSHELMNVLHNWSGGRARVMFTRRWPGETSRVIAVSVPRPYRPQPTTLVSFAVLVDGQHPERVERFVRSIEALDKRDGLDYEILVCGPEGSVDHLASKSLRLIHEDERFSALGWITRKKNQLIQAARGEIIVIAHDRYWMTPDFLTELDAYGHDFDVLVPSQRTPAGFRYPSIVATTGTWDLSAVAELERGDFSPNLYINGGLIVAHTEVLRRVPFNELLFWGDAEDVELTRRMSNEGIIPRFSGRVSVVTEVSRADQISVFERMPYVAEYITPALDAPFYPPGLLITFDANTQPTSEFSRGVVIPRDWRPEASGLCWTGTTRPEFTIRPRRPLTDHSLPWSLMIGLQDGGIHAAQVEILINSERAALRRIERFGSVDELSYELPTDLIANGHSFVVQFVTPLEQSTRLRSIRLDVGSDPQAVPTTIRFGDFIKKPPPVTMTGWSAIEPWGVWSEGSSASMMVPLKQEKTGGELILDVELQPFVPHDHGEQRVVVSSNGAPIEIWRFTELGYQTRTLRVASPARKLDWLHLEFQVAWPTSPLQEGLAGDPRLLGVGLRSLRIRRAIGRGHARDD